MVLFGHILEIDVFPNSFGASVYLQSVSLTIKDTFYKSNQTFHHQYKSTYWYSVFSIDNVPESCLKQLFIFLKQSISIAPFEWLILCLKSLKLERKILCNDLRTPNKALPIINNQLVNQPWDIFSLASQTFIPTLIYLIQSSSH